MGLDATRRPCFTLPGMAEDLIAAIARNRKWSGHLRGWLLEHYDELLPVLSVARPPWASLARTAAEHGIKPENAPHYSRQAVRDAWLRLKQTRVASEPEAPILPLASRRGREASVPPPPVVVNAPKPTTPEGTSDEQLGSSEIPVQARGDRGRPEQTRRSCR